MEIDGEGEEKLKDKELNTTAKKLDLGVFNVYGGVDFRKTLKQFASKCEPELVKCLHMRATLSGGTQVKVPRCLLVDLQRATAPLEWQEFVQTSSLFLKIPPQYSDTELKEMLDPALGNDRCKVARVTPGGWFVKVTSTDTEWVSTQIQAGWWSPAFCTPFKVEAPRNRGRLAFRCFKCFQLGHFARVCPNDVVCAKCAGGDHAASECQSQQLKCHLCKGAHRATDVKCPQNAPSSKQKQLQQANDNRKKKKQKQQSRQPPPSTAGSNSSSSNGNSRGRGEEKEERKTLQRQPPPPPGSSWPKPGAASSQQWVSTKEEIEAIVKNAVYIALAGERQDHEQAASLLQKQINDVTDALHKEQKTTEKLSKVVESLHKLIAADALQEEEKRQQPSSSSSSRPKRKEREKTRATPPKQPLLQKPKRDLNPSTTSAATSNSDSSFAKPAAVVVTPTRAHLERSKSPAEVDDVVPPFPSFHHQPLPPQPLATEKLSSCPSTHHTPALASAKRSKDRSSPFFIPPYSNVSNTTNTSKTTPLGPAPIRTTTAAHLHARSKSLDEDRLCSSAYVDPRLPVSREYYNLMYIGDDDSRARLKYKIVRFPDPLFR
jgi:hypothetical protein